MSSFKRTYVCFKCMNSVRDTVERTCPDCRKPMDGLFYKIRIPQRKEKLWKKFKNWLSETYPFYRDKV